MNEHSISKKDKMAEKVAKLLRQADDVAGTPEEQMFQARAFELLAKYGLDEAKIRAEKMGQENALEPDAVCIDIVVSTGKYIPMQVTLLGQLANALHCRLVQFGAKGAIRCQLFGLPEHTERVQFVYELLRPQMIRQADAAKPAYYMHSGELRIYRRSFMVGFITTVAHRLAEQEQNIARQAGALVLYKSADDRAVDAMMLAHPRVKEQKTRGQLDGSAYSEGVSAGRKAKMNDSLGS